MSIRTINPATGALVAEHQTLSSSECVPVLQRAYEAFLEWRTAEFAERGRGLREVACSLRRRIDEQARLMAVEMGKPVAQGRSEIEKCAWACEYFAEHAAGFLDAETAELDDDGEAWVAFRPLGVVLAVMPWNYPFWQVFRCAAPALMAGNTVVLKHASNVAGCARAIEATFQEAGCPPGIFQVLLTGAAQMPDVVRHPVVQAVTVTGSVSAGRSVAAVAGKALKKTVLELGGSDPYVVLEDCDLETAVDLCVRSRLLNSGQSCIAAKRFIVVEAVREAFERRFIDRMADATVGDPLAEETTVGPLAREDLREELHGQVQRTREAGARLRCGGELPTGKGWFYPPTVLSDVRQGMAAFEEETFGPVAAIIPARDETEAIRLANASPYGLGAAVFTRDQQRGRRLAIEQIEAGNCFVNDFVKSDPRLPFGGIRESGYGRELGVFGIREFVNVKTVWVKAATIP
jgi:succinate-semialdehyde dehydrogenase/glutarate-semialdehyde dehydrogenase